jgi:hypothetical protein
MKHALILLGIALSASNCSDASFSDVSGKSLNSSKSSNDGKSDDQNAGKGVTFENSAFGDGTDLQPSDDNGNGDPSYLDGGSGDGSSCESNRKGKILVTNDEWQVSDTGFQNSAAAGIFAQNIAEWLGTCGTRKNGKFHAYSSNFSLSEPSLAAALSQKGHTWTSGIANFAVTLENLKNYDWIFLAGPIPTFDANVFIEYVEQGGGLYIAGGTGNFSSASAEANHWNSIINHFGISYTGSYNGIRAVVPTVSDHQIFANVPGLYQNNGNTVFLTASATQKSRILIQYNNQGMYAIFDDAL